MIHGDCDALGLCLWPFKESFDGKQIHISHHTSSYSFQCTVMRLANIAVLKQTTAIANLHNNGTRALLHCCTAEYLVFSHFDAVQFIGLDMISYSVPI